MATPIGPDPSLRPLHAAGATPRRGPASQAARGPSVEEAPERGEEAPGVDRVATPNGMVRETRADGELRVALPTGHLLVHRPGEEPWVLGPEGERLQAGRQENGDAPLYGFVDARGNQVLLQPSEMAFALRDAAGTVTQHVHASGAQSLETRVPFRNSVTGETREVVQRVAIDAEGRVEPETELPGGVRVAPDGLEFGTRGVRFDLPYRIPQDLHGPAAAPPRAESAASGPEPAPPRQPGPQGAPDVIFETPPPGAGPSGASGPREPFPGPGPKAPPPGSGAAFHRTPGDPTPVPPGAPGMDPYAPVQTASGLIRQRTPEGMLVISLPNGIVLSQAPDGTATAFDARSEGPTPVEVRPHARPDGTTELRFEFPDSLGNLYTLFSDSQDFSVRSADGRTRQLVLPQGNVLVRHQDPQGVQHRVELLPNGGVQTFGEGGVQVGPDRVLFGSARPPELVALPYPLPPFHGFQGFMGFPGGAAPTSGAGPAGFEMPASAPTWAGGPGMPPGFGMPPGSSSEVPPVTPRPGEPQQPLKPGLWQRVKDFFAGEPGPPPGMPGPYPGHHHRWTMDPMTGMIAASMAHTAMNTAFLAASMMYPMGMFCTPFVPVCW